MHSSALKSGKESGPTLERCVLRFEQADLQPSQALIGTRMHWLASQGGEVMAMAQGLFRGLGDRVIKR